MKKFCNYNSKRHTFLENLFFSINEIIKNIKAFIKNCIPIYNQTLTKKNCQLKMKIYEYSTNNKSF